MKYFRNTMDFSIREPSAIALGKFDGLHQGHKYLLRQIKKGEEFGYRSVAFTFDVPPSSFADQDIKVLLTNAEKEQIFASIGIDYVVECPFTEKLKKMEPHEFLRMLTDRINVRQIVAGEDFRFGRDRNGSVRDLLKYQRELGYHVVIVDRVQYEGKDISSTRIRSLIRDGDMEKANLLLGYPYFLTAPVTHGEGIGKEMGIPTVNQVPPEEKLLPPNGVYASVATLDDRSLYGVSDIGCKPTIEGKHPLGVETHLFDFDEQIYDREIRVSFLDFLRPEKRFDSVRELRAQITEDCEKAKKTCEENSQR